MSKKSAAAASAWPADRVERRPTGSLIPYARNARTHSEAQVAQIAASIREFGFTVPVLVDEDSGIIAGHGRVLAAGKLGLDTVPVMVARGWSDAQRRAYVLADNQLALNAGWNNDLLAIELADLQAVDFDLGLTGFAPGQLADFIGGRDIEPGSIIGGPGSAGSSAEPSGADGDDDAGPTERTAPDDFPSYGEDIPTEHECPKCGYAWSGRSGPAA